MRLNGDVMRELAILIGLGLAPVWIVLYHETFVSHSPSDVIGIFVMFTVATFPASCLVALGSFILKCPPGADGFSTPDKVCWGFSGLLILAIVGCFCGWWH